MIKQVLLITALMASSVAHAGFYSGSALLSESEGYVKNKSGVATVAEAVNGGMFMGYIAGVFDTYAMQGNRNICPKAGLSVGSASDAVMQYLNEHPEQLNYSAPSVIMLALTATFPCERH
ncbi:Rap1a/Tai family immunity protein [Serratia sp. NPDC078593]|uniref:Rap1a/Tai family immunity protein n=1 Tax=unclassified Serratia (in: enterobacteria) TaxID=2647522 RepID=UPI0037D1E226